LAQVCQKKHVQLIVSGLNHQPLDIASRTGLLTWVGQQNYPDWSSALQAAVLSENL